MLFGFLFYHVFLPLNVNVQGHLLSVRTLQRIVLPSGVGPAGSLVGENWFSFPFLCYDNKWEQSLDPRKVDARKYRPPPLGLDFSRRGRIPTLKSSLTWLQIALPFLQHGWRQQFWRCHRLPKPAVAFPCFLAFNFRFYPIFMIEKLPFWFKNLITFPYSSGCNSVFVVTSFPPTFFSRFSFCPDRRARWLQ